MGPRRISVIQEHASNEPRADRGPSRSDGWRAWICGLRVPVAEVVDMVAEGLSAQEVLAGHPDLEAEDICEALRHVAETVGERELPLGW
jgi:uncharacterized protein (DUF433 family)